MHFSSLNLARKWRCKKFDTLKGQALTLRFLKNSLYKGILYPLYLFSGMRGTGKTTVARVFSAAMLCRKLSYFQKDHTVVLPCYACDSCKAFEEEMHPDICEIDAASHTGVDTIRSLIDNAYLLPVLSERKVYIIDEAHMLSKAAFNACLKVMEEPPAHVHFILATTDVHKVLETVRSRSVHLHFDPLSLEQMSTYLQEVCEKEGIKYEKEGLDHIAHASQGSVRDALNILERIRLACDVIDSKTVSQCMGVPAFSLIEEWLDAFIKGDLEKAKEILTNIRDQAGSSLRAQGLWELICIGVRKRLVSSTSSNGGPLLRLLDLLYLYEPLYMNSSLPYGLLDLLMYKGIGDKDDAEKIVFPLQMGELKKNVEEKKSVPVQGLESGKDSSLQSGSSFQDYRSFVEQISLKDRILGSLFKQAQVDFDSQQERLVCSFNKKLLFYRDFIEDKKALWTPVLKEIYGDKIILEIDFVGVEGPSTVTSSVEPSSNVKNEGMNPTPFNNSSKQGNQEVKRAYKPGSPSSVVSHSSSFIKNLNALFPGTTERI